MNSDKKQTGPIQKLFEERAADMADDKRVRLMGVLSDSVQFYVKGTKERFFLKFDNGEFTCEEGIEKKPGSTITISEADIEAIADDRLNPQIAMISDKVKIEGKTALALYVFNIITD